MRRRAIFGLFISLLLLGCGRAGRLIVEPAGEPDPPPDVITPEPIDPLVCDYCVGTAPATFTGPSNFWRGKLGFAPACKDPTPLQGIEGVLV
jgi:hypothetical protein